MADGEHNMKKEKKGETGRPYKKIPVRAAPAQKETSWGHVANWYHEHVSESDDTYHEKVIKPNLLRVIGDSRGKRVLDVACGEGFFSRALTAAGAHVTGADIAPELIAIANAAMMGFKMPKNLKTVDETVFSGKFSEFCWRSFRQCDVQVLCEKL